MKKKVLSTITLYSERCKRSRELLEENGFEVIEYHGDTVMTFEEIKAVGSDIFGAILGCDVWNEETFQACPNLKVLARFGVGVDCIDLEAAKRHGVMVCSAKGMNCDSVGEVTLLFALAMLRDLVDLNHSTKAGDWATHTGSIVHGKTYGLVGFGVIAQYVAKLLEPFAPAKIYAYDVMPNYEMAEKLGVEMTDFDTLLKESDIISVHIPGLEENVNLFNEEVFRKMKKTAVFINVARGCVVDEAALYKALNEKWIAKAATDVFAEEPTPKDNPLLTLDNLICLPHKAGDTHETFDAVGYFCAQVIIDVMNGKVPMNWLNP